MNRGCDHCKPELNLPNSEKAKDLLSYENYIRIFQGKNDDNVTGFKLVSIGCKS